MVLLTWKWYYFWKITLFLSFMCVNGSGSQRSTLWSPFSPLSWLFQVISPMLLDDQDFTH